MFGANFIKGKVRSQVNGNWNGAATFKMTFKSGGAIEFGQAMLKAAYLGMDVLFINVNFIYYLVLCDPDLNFSTIFNIFNNKILSNYKCFFFLNLKFFETFSFSYP